MSFLKAGAAVLFGLVVATTVGDPALSRQPAGMSTASPMISVVYKCDNGDTIPATYPRFPAPGPATISLHGRKIQLQTALSADGGRYLAPSGLTSGRVLEWWSKGSGATLSEGPLNQGDDGSKTLITTCRDIADK